jgi:hypothetical protein
MEQLCDEGKVDDFSVVFGGANVLHVLVDRHLIDPEGARPAAAKAPRERSKSAKKV